jgi:hypothetical protein
MTENETKDNVFDNPTQFPVQQARLPGRRGPLESALQVIGEQRRMRTKAGWTGEAGRRY